MKIFQNAHCVLYLYFSEKDTSFLLLFIISFFSFSHFTFSYFSELALEQFSFNFFNRFSPPISTIGAATTAVTTNANATTTTTIKTNTTKTEHYLYYNN